MFDDVALDIFGKEGRRVCTDGLLEEEVRAYETVAAAYAFAYSTMIQMPGTVEDITNIMDNVLGLPVANLDDDAAVLGTPWGLAKATVDELVNYSASDGWNSDGSLANNFNKQPYSDFSFQDADGNEYEAYENVVNDFRVKYNHDDGQCKKIVKKVFW